MSIENTTWNISGVGAIICEFKTNNVVTMTFANGQSSDKNWDELNGSFAIESPNSTNDPEKWQVYAGAYAGNIAHGVLYSFGVGNGPQHFTMTKTS